MQIVQGSHTGPPCSLVRFWIEENIGFSNTTSIQLSPRQRRNHHYLKLIGGQGLRLQGQQSQLQQIRAVAGGDDDAELVQA
jgi:hypothetical protein